MKDSATATHIVTPIIHLNGDRRETLLAQLETAYRAVRQAIAAVRACAPSERNFYPEPERFARYLHQHQSRLAHLKDVYASLEAEAIHIQDEA